jgi:hypothetical protein
MAEYISMNQYDFSFTIKRKYYLRNGIYCVMIRAAFPTSLTHPTVVGIFGLLIIQKKIFFFTRKHCVCGRSRETKICIIEINLISSKEFREYFPTRAGNVVHEKVFPLNVFPRFIQTRKVSVLFFPF